MKKFLLLLLIPFVIYSQEDEKNPGVELPEFIITGKDLINLQQTKKAEAELLPLIRDEYLKPELNPENLELGDVSGPGNTNLKLRDSADYKTGHIKTSVGIYTLPLVNAGIASPFEGGLFEGHLDGENIRPYIKNAERYFFKAGAGLLLFSDYESTFLPGNEYSLKGDFGSKSYKLFAGINPTEKRDLYSGSLSFSVKNLNSEKFLFSLEPDYKYSAIRDEEFTEGLFNLNGFGRMNFEQFNSGIYLTFKNQMFSDSNTTSAYYNFFSVRPYAGFNISSVVKLSVGLTYSHARNNSITAPYADIGFKLTRNITLYGEYSPGGDFITASELLDKNIYFNPQNHSNFFVKKTNDLKALVKFEYNRYFEINGGFKYKTFDNYAYFTDMNPDGRFFANTADADYYGIYLNLLFHRGPFGYFYASGEAGELKDEKNNLIPYFSSIISSLTYGYDFPIGLNAETNLIYRSAVYADSANTKKIDAYINLNINLSYKISENLKFLAGVNNLLDRKNIIWNNYREIPLDISAGISYNW